MNKIKGFTLIELLVVVLIIGILAAIALPQYQIAVEKSRSAEGMVFLDAVAKAESIYFMSNNTYTTDDSALDLEFAPLQNFTVGDVSSEDGSFRMMLNNNNTSYPYALLLWILEGNVYKVCLGNERICRSISGGKECPTGPDEYTPWCYGGSMDEPEPEPEPDPYCPPGTPCK